MNNNNENWVHERVKFTKPMNTEEQTAFEGIKGICSTTRWFGGAHGFYEIFKPNSIFNTKAIMERIRTACFSFLTRFDIHNFRHLARVYHFFCVYEASLMCVCVSVCNWIFGNIIRRLPFEKQHTPLLPLPCQRKSWRKCTKRSDTHSLTPSVSASLTCKAFIPFYKY